MQSGSGPKLSYNALDIHVSSISREWGGQTFQDHFLISYRESETALSSTERRMERSVSGKAIRASLNCIQQLIEEVPQYLVPRRLPGPPIRQQTRDIFG